MLARRELLLLVATVPFAAACARPGERAAPPGTTAGAPADAWTVDDAGGASLDDRRPWREVVPAALARVRTVWGEAGPGRVVLVVPADESEYVSRMGGPSQGGATTVFGASWPQVVVSPGARLTLRQRQALLAHELAHVAQRLSGTGGTGTWLLEGSAVLTQYVGEQPAHHAETVLVRQAARQGTLPDGPPRPGSFSGGEGSRLAYQVAWTMCLFLEARVGRPTVVELARDVTRGAVPAAALAARTGLTEESMVRGWQAWVRTWA